MEALLDAIEDKLPDKVEEIVGSGTVNINQCDGDGYTPLILACTVGHHDNVDFLIESKAAVDFTAPDGASALFCAVQEGHWEVVELLIDSDADVNLQTNGGATPLYIAAQEGFKSLVGKLLKHGAKPNCRAHGVSPLFIACQERHVSCVKELIKGKADVNVKNKSGGLPLIVSCFKGHTPVVKELVGAVNLDVNKCAAGISALMTAAKMKKLDCIAELIKHEKLNLNLKSKNQERNTAGHFAATANAPEVLDALKAAGADLAYENSEGLTPADIMLASHGVKYDGPRGNSGNVVTPKAANESKGDDADDRKEKKSKKKNKKSKKSKKEEKAKRKLQENAEAEALAAKMFAKYDLNDDGALDTPEFMSCLIDLGFKDLFPGDQFKHKVRQCFKEFDKDGSGTIDKFEFLVFYNWMKKEHGLTANQETKVDTPQISKQKSKKKIVHRETEVEKAEKDAHVDYYILSRDPKVDFGVNFKVQNFGPEASKIHHLLKNDKEYLVVRNLRNLPDGSLGPATLQGIEEDDIILHLEKKEVSTFADFAKRTKGKKDIHVSILRIPHDTHHRGRHGKHKSQNWGKGQATAFHADPLKPKGIDTGFLPSISGR